MALKEMGNKPRGLRRRLLVASRVELVETDRPSLGDLGGTRRLDHELLLLGEEKPEGPRPRGEQSLAIHFLLGPDVVVETTTVQELEELLVVLDRDRWRRPAPGDGAVGERDGLSPVLREDGLVGLREGKESSHEGVAVLADTFRGTAEILAGLLDPGFVVRLQPVDQTLVVADTADVRIGLLEIPGSGDRCTLDASRGRAHLF